MDEIVEQRLRAIERTLQALEADHLGREERAWVRLQIRITEERQKMWSSVKASALGWFVISVLGLIGLALWHWISSKLGGGQ
jgi:hypothetical protein